MNKRGQVTIFVIIAIVIVASIAVFLSFREGIISPQIGESTEENPAGFLETCMRDKITEVIDILYSRGGSVSNPLNKTFQFDEEIFPTDISYLCYTGNYFIPCTNQETMLIQNIKEDIKNYVSSDAKNCFDKLTASLNNEGFVVDARYDGINVDMIDGKVIINFDAELALTKSGETTKQTEFDIVRLSRLYDAATIAQEISSQEAKYCNFEYVGYMLLYPQWSIDKLRTSDSSIIYSIKHQDDENKFRFAVRGCVIRPGL